MEDPNKDKWNPEFDLSSCSVPEYMDRGTEDWIPGQRFEKLRLVGSVYEKSKLKALTKPRRSLYSFTKPLLIRAHDMKEACTEGKCPPLMIQSLSYPNSDATVWVLFLIPCILCALIKSWVSSSILQQTTTSLHIRKLQVSHACIHCILKYMQKNPEWPVVQKWFTLKDYQMSLPPQNLRIVWVLMLCEVLMWMIFQNLGFQWENTSVLQEGVNPLNPFVSEISVPHRWMIMSRMALELSCLNQMSLMEITGHLSRIFVGLITCHQSLSWVNNYWGIITSMASASI